MRRNLVIKESDIQRALEEFRDLGGRIHTLPDSKTLLHNIVGAELGMFETLDDLASGQIYD